MFTGLFMVYHKTASCYNSGAPGCRWGIEELRGTYTIHDGDAVMKIERVFEVEKETKNTIRYSEVAEGQPPVIGTIYVQKWALTGIPKQVKVTLEAEEE